MDFMINTARTETYTERLYVCLQFLDGGWIWASVCGDERWLLHAASESRNTTSSTNGVLHSGRLHIERQAGLKIPNVNSDTELGCYQTLVFPFENESWWTEEVTAEAGREREAVLWVFVMPVLGEAKFSRFKLL